jgi:hypothetical protein
LGHRAFASWRPRTAGRRRTAQSCSSTSWTFYPEFRSVSESHARRGAWQAVQDGRPYGRAERTSRGRCRWRRALALEARLGPAELVTNGMSAWLIEHAVAVELPGGYLGLATRDGSNSKLRPPASAFRWKTGNYAALLRYARDAPVGRLACAGRSESVPDGLREHDFDGRDGRTVPGLVHLHGEEVARLRRRAGSERCDCGSAATRRAGGHTVGMRARFSPGAGVTALALVGCGGTGSAAPTGGAGDPNSDAIAGAGVDTTASTDAGCFRTAGSGPAVHMRPADLLV